MMKPTIDILKDARHLISDQKRWTQFAYARNPKGHPVSASDADAVSFDASGALMVASGFHLKDGAEGGYCLAERFLKSANSEFADGMSYYTSTNDGYIRIGFLDPYEAILKVFDRAVELAELDNA